MLILLFLKVVVCSIQFRDQDYYVDETNYNTVDIFVDANQISIDDIIFRCELSSNASEDFFSITAVGTIKSSDLSGICQFTIRDDDIPEASEKFPVSLRLLRGNTTVRQKNVTITIRPSDDPFGCIGFSPAANVVIAKEPNEGDAKEFSKFLLMRYGGTIGELVITWKILQETTDVYPTEGFISFIQGQTNQTLIIEILPDNLPEAEEIFSITIQNLSGDGCILINASEAELRIKENDAPIQFLNHKVSVSEGSVFKVIVLRGLDLSENRVGSISEPASVFYKTVPVSATPGNDYIELFGKLIFESGITRKEIYIQILSDLIPELKETFKVILFNTTQAILGNLTEVLIEIPENDDPYGLLIFDKTSTVIQEDMEGFVEICINRTRGSFGNITAFWKINGTDSDSVFQVTSGFISFFSGEKYKSILVSVKKNNIPQEASIFTLQLVNVTGSARFENLVTGSSMQIIVADNDDAYGTVGFSSEEANVFLSTTPRYINIKLSREGGLLADVVVHYSSYYFVESFLNMSSWALINPNGTIVFKVGQSNQNLTIEIKNDVFLSSDSYFVIELDSIEVAKTTLVAPSSPQLTKDHAKRINITSNLANGEIGFFNTPIYLTIPEPIEAFSVVNLTLMRDGTATDVEVFWLISSKNLMFTEQDVKSLNGSVFFKSGMDRANLSIQVLADDIPELDEEFVVELINLYGVNDRLREGARLANVKILQNDNPGGIISFSRIASITLEESSITDVEVVRTGGLLVVQKVLLEVLAGEIDFKPYQEVITFSPGVSTKRVYLVPDDDDIPELDETFTVRLSSVSGSIVGTNSSFNITILSNDDPHGLISFKDISENLNQEVREFKMQTVAATFLIIRSKGLFGNLQVSWTIFEIQNSTYNSAEKDIFPTSGVVTIEEGKSLASISVFIKKDEEPEAEEIFYVIITSVQGGATIKQPLQATLRVPANDFPVTLLPSVLFLNEGEGAKLTIHLSKMFMEIIVVEVKILFESISESDLLPFNMSITFLPLETEKDILIQAIPDGIPEMNETCVVFLASTTGDTVLHMNFSTIVTVLANDDPYGVFDFSDINPVYIEEGSSIVLRVNRLMGLYKNVTIHWNTFALTKSLSLERDLEKSNGTLLFEDGQSQNTFSITIQKDGLPELEEIFIVQLLNITGAQARLGANTTLNVNIQSSDYPNGVFEINSNLSTMFLAEDKDDLPLDGQLVFERKYGSFFSAKIVWQIYEDSIKEPAQVWDLLFHADNTESLFQSQGRMYSSTPAYYFKNECVHLDMKNCPYNNFDSGFTIGVWFKTNVSSHGMSLLKKTSIDGVVDIEITVNMSKFSLLLNKKRLSESTKSLYDDEWHSLFFAVKSEMITIYLDDSILKNSSNPGVTIKSSDKITIGCGMYSPFNGFLQDLQLYQRFFWDVKALTLPYPVISPSNGVLTFDAGETKKIVFIQSIDDTIPETDTLYGVHIIDIKDSLVVRDKAVISNEKSKFQINVLKSDFASGIFLLDQGSCPYNISESSQGFNITIIRVHGLFGSVVIEWNIKGEDGNIADDDFFISNGAVVFMENEINKVILIVPYDDSFPELEERYSINIKINSSINKPVKNFATVNTSSSQCNFTIARNDHPFGVFQLMTNTQNITSGVMLSEPLSVNIQEEVSLLSLYVVRLFGDEGSVSVEWRTRGFDGTNNTSGLTAIGGLDFEENIGVIKMKAGEKFVKISVKIFDNKKPELTKSFLVELKNPSMAELGIASVLYIHILPSDDALGLFSFPIIDYTTSEGLYVNISIKRSGGALDNVNLMWSLVNGSNEFSLSQGEVSFQYGVKERFILLQALDDENPELTEIFLIQLLNVSGGSISDINQTATLRILSSDYPYGLFEFEKKTVDLEEKNSLVFLQINRNKGNFGHIRLHFNTTNLISNQSSAVINEDFKLNEWYVDFLIGQKFASINISILDDEKPELLETFVISLTNVEIIHEFNATSLPLEEVSISIPNMIIVNILPNDNPHGILQFKYAKVHVLEDYNYTFLSVQRSKGLYGKVSFSYSVESISAYIGLDFSVLSFSAMIEENKDETMLPIITIIDDLPEFNETFKVSLLPGTFTGGLVMGSLSTCEVTILENDFPYGKIGFSNHDDVVVTEPESFNQKVVLRVNREGGNFGNVRIRWEAYPNIPLFGDNDLVPLEGYVGFLTGEISQTIVLNIMPDDIPEINETYIILLKEVVIGDAVINKEKSSIKIIILLNDNPYGMVQFVKPSIEILEKENDWNVTLFINRINGLFGVLRVFWRTNQLSSFKEKAIAGSDYESISNQFFIIENGSSISEIKILIYHDEIPELNEVFQVELMRIEVLNENIPFQHLPILGAISYMNITILQNDEPFGMLTLTLDGYGLSKNTHPILEPEYDNLTLLFYVSRKKGAFGRISVSWQVQSTEISTDDICCRGDIIVFEQDERLKTFTITVFPDSIPENDEEFSVFLLNSTDGSSIDLNFNKVQVVILANDNVGGIVRFCNGSVVVSIREGERLSLCLQRTLAALGDVIVTWRIIGVNVTQDFISDQGFANFSEGQTFSSITLESIMDQVPETDESFVVRLIAIETVGISNSGSAILDETFRESFLTIAASDFPHGVVEIANADSPLYVHEYEKQVEILLIRQFGKIGTLSISYNVFVGVNRTISQASIQDDIYVLDTKLTIADGEDSAIITVGIIDDNLAELDEEFFVEILSVNLTKSFKNSSSIPVVGLNKQKRVIIVANDAPHGVLAFAPHSVNFAVKEENSAFNLTVVRSFGTFGEVYCFYFLNYLTADSSDFYINGSVMDGGPAKILFVDGQSEANITVYINDDNITENNEFFEVGLTIQNAINNGGVQVGVPSRTIITISSNDDAHGIFSFALSSQNIFLPEPENLNLISHDFEVERTGGLFGRVILEWRACNATPNYDISPISGILQFEEYQRRASFRVSILPDDLPELEKIIVLQLNMLNGNARLGTVSHATLTIAANDYPFGLFSFFPENVIYVEELQKLVKITVVRNGGTYGDVTVDFITEPNTALSDIGNQTIFGIDFSFMIGDVIAFHSFEMLGEQFLILGTQKNTKLFVWRGTFVYILDLPLKNLTKIVTSVIGMETILLVKDFLSIQVYLMGKNFSLFHVQTIYDVGISDVLLFKMNNSLYFTFAKSNDDQGESIQMLQLYIWNKQKFTQLLWSGIQTFFGQSLAFTNFNNEYYLAVANRYNRLSNSYNVKSYIYKWDSRTKYFQMYGEIETYKAEEINFFQHEGTLFVTVVNGNGNCQLLMHDVKRYDHFYLKQEFYKPCINIKYFYTPKHAYLVAVGTASYLYEWNRNHSLFEFHMVLPFSDLYSIEPFFVTDLNLNVTISYLAAFSANTSNILRIAYMKNSSDFVFRNERLYFMEGEKSLFFFVSIVDDQLPETDETFKVRLLNPSSDAAVSSSSILDIVIMSNDNAFGRFKIADSSLHQVVNELNIDSTFFVLIEREFGSNGVAIITYNITDTANNIQEKIYPQYGHVKFFPGENLKKLNLYLKGDVTPELEKKMLLRLVDIETVSGTDTSQATLNYNINVASITIPANDDPYGVFTWKNSIYVTTESVTTTSLVLLILKREKGTFGCVTVLFETVIASEVGPMERPAKPFVDFIPIYSNVTFTESQREAFVFIEVIPLLKEERIINATLKDGLYNYNEIFFVNITNAYLTEDNQTTVSIVSSLTQVVITEMVQQNGVLDFNSSVQLITNENVGTLEIPVSRSVGFNGSVGVYFEVLFHTANIFDIAPSNGTVSFENNQNEAFLQIQIENDNIPELDENFTIILTKPFGGAKIGSLNNLTVKILENEHPYGFFSIQEDNRNIMVEEGDDVLILVVRSYGVMGDVDIKWKCNGTNSMTSLQEGVVHFFEGERAKNISFMIIDDDIPELSQVILCEITSGSNHVELSNFTKALIIINASDKPFGIYVVNPISRIQAGFEPINGVERKLNISVLRKVGQANLSTLSWKFNSSSHTKVKETFKETFGTLTFKTGEIEKVLTLEILDDDIPEEANMFELILYNPTNGAELSSDINSTVSYIYIAASDYPYGLFALNYNQWDVDESVGVLNIPIIRSGGLFGGVSIGYHILNGSAASVEDYSPESGVLVFAPYDTIQVIQITIHDDAIPELNEMFTVNLTSAQLDHFIDFDEVVQGIKLNTPPLITGCCQIVVIKENDDPYGVIEFLTSKIFVQEWDLSLKIPVVRKGGLFTNSSVSFTYTPINATANSDFVINSTVIELLENQNLSFIEVWLIDDNEPEDLESFEIRLMSVAGLSKLGIQDKLLVVIELSDNPNGLFGFYDSPNIIYIKNPLNITVLSFNISRMDGTVGTVNLEWLIESENHSPVSEDILPSSGLIIFADKQSKSKELKISILPHSKNHELAERFTLRLVNATGGGKIQTSAAYVTIVVDKKGYPNGLFSFGLAFLEVEEPSFGFKTVKIEVKRELGMVGTVEITWSLIPVSNGSSFEDVTFNLSPLKFLAGESSQYIYLNITSDNIPEINETFYLNLLSATNEGEIHKNMSVLELVIVENDDPFGIFNLPFVDLFVDSSNQRFINFTVQRSAGTFGEVNAFVEVTLLSTIVLSSELHFNQGDVQLSKILKFNSSLFLPNGSVLNIELQNVTLVTKQMTLLSPRVNHTNSRKQLILPELMCNSVVNIYPSFGSLSNGNVSVYVKRVGLFSSITVTINSSLNNYKFKNGQLNPSFKSITMTHGMKETLIVFKAVIPDPLIEPLIYSLFIANLQPTQNQLGWPKLGLETVSVIDPYGIIQVCRTCIEMSVVEGELVKVVIERIMGAQGKIRVFYETKSCNLYSALPGIDFIEFSSYVDFEEGEFFKDIYLTTLDDALSALPEDKKCFLFSLTSVQLLTVSLANVSPRLSDSNTSRIVIEDNDFPYGILSFTKPTIDLSESSTSFAEIEVQRLFGSFSLAKVDVVSIGGGEIWSDEYIEQSSIDINKELSKILNRASAGSDYSIVKTTLVFPKMDELSLKGQVQKLSFRIFQDNIPEPDESFLLVLSNATGGSKINTSGSYTLLTIKANGLFNGEVGFEKTTAEIDEDGSQFTDLIVSRNGESLEDITVSWTAFHPFEPNVLNQLQLKSGELVILAGQQKAALRINLISDDDPELVKWLLINITGVSKGAYVRKLDSVANITILESDAPAGVIGFDTQSRYVVVEVKENFATLTITRYNGTLKNVSVSYRTLVVTNIVRDAGIDFNPAIEGSDFQFTNAKVNMAVGQSSAKINVKLSPETASIVAYPKIFNVILEMPTNGAMLQQDLSKAVVVISQVNPQFLKLRSTLLSLPMLDSQITIVLSSILSNLLSKALSDEDQQVIKTTIDEILSFKNSEKPGYMRINKDSLNNLLQIFNVLLDPRRLDSKGKSFWVKSLENLAFHLLNDLPCPSSVFYKMSNFDLKAYRINGTLSEGFVLQDGINFLSYSQTEFPLNNAAKCSNLQFLVLKNSHLFIANENVLNAKVMSSSVFSGLNPDQKVNFRIYTSQKRVTRAPAKCVIWEHALVGNGFWSPTNCKLVLQSKNYVQCECEHLSEYAVLASSDNNTGFEIYFFVACFITGGACFLALLAHHCCSVEKTFTANLLMHMFFAVMSINVVYAVGAYVSPTLFNNQEACSVLGVFLHYLFLAQFTTMFAQAYNLWRILVKNDEHSYRKYMIFFLISWGSPIFIIICYAFITYAVWGWTFNKMYADVHNDGDMCFIPQAYAAFSVAVIPVLLLILGSSVVFVQAYQLTPQWKCYDDVYRGRYNIIEVRHFMVLFALISTTWLFGGLHLAYRYLWMIVIFTFFNVITGLYILIIYAILRNQMRYIFKGEYYVKQSENIMELPNVVYKSPQLKKETPQREYIDLNEWDTVDLRPITPASSSKTVFKSKSIDPRLRVTPSSSQFRGAVNEIYNDENDDDYDDKDDGDNISDKLESAEFEDLIFALKSGRGYASSLNEDSIENQSNFFENDRPMSNMNVSDRSSVRRIKIGDTIL